MLGAWLAKVFVWSIIWKWIKRIVLGFFIVSIGWVLLYKFVPVPLTFFMLQRCVEQKVDGETVQLKKDWVSRDEISDYVELAVVCAEDQNYLKHNGFDFGAIEKAMKYNEKMEDRGKTKRRGASTISMQLVKNVFLTREKTLSRKLEEILLVYILENNRISTKERMLEVYFNVIEWGPNVYGIGEAAQFYFQKRPAELNLNECLFLATIVPKPKGFMYRFDSEQQLKSFARQQNDFLTRLMLRRKLLTETDTIGNFPLTISGAAQQYLKQKIVPAVVNDSLNTEEFDF